jgi:hypothetical protein
MATSPPTFHPGSRHQQQSGHCIAEQGSQTHLLQVATVWESKMTLLANDIRVKRTSSRDGSPWLDQDSSKAKPQRCTASPGSTSALCLVQRF